RGWILLAGPGIAGQIVPVGRPFPYVAGHVVRPERAYAGGIAQDGRGILISIVIGPVSLHVRHVGRGFDLLIIAPRVDSPVAAAGRRLPLGLGRERLAGPAAVGPGLPPVHV